MVRKILFAAALATSSIVGLVSPAAAQRYESVTLNAGSRYGYDDGGYRHGYRGDSYDRHRAVDGRRRERWERRLYWERQHEGREHAWRERQWRGDRGHGGDHDGEWHRRGY